MIDASYSSLSLNLADAFRNGAGARITGSRSALDRAAGALLSDWGVRRAVLRPGVPSSLGRGLLRPALAGATSGAGCAPSRERR